MVPNIKDKYGNDPRLCRVLGLLILWASFDQNFNALLKIGTSIHDKFHHDFEDIVGMEEPLFNQVRKVPLLIVNAEG